MFKSSTRAVLNLAKRTLGMDPIEMMVKRMVFKSGSGYKQREEVYGCQELQLHGIQKDFKTLPASNFDLLDAVKKLKIIFLEGSL